VLKFTHTHLDHTIVPSETREKGTIEKYRGEEEK
jgi:hypothetical protein